MLFFLIRLKRIPFFSFCYNISFLEKRLPESLKNVCLYSIIWLFSVVMHSCFDSGLLSAQYVLDWSCTYGPAGLDLYSYCYQLDCKYFHVLFISIESLMDYDPSIKEERYRRVLHCLIHLLRDALFL